MKIKLAVPIKKFKVPSKRKNPDTGEVLCYWIVELLSNGKLDCNCPAGSFRRNCRHKQIIKKYLQKDGRK